MSRGEGTGDFELLAVLYWKTQLRDTRSLVLNQIELSSFEYKKRSAPEALYKYTLYE
jgi:hypothetical protein